MAKPEIHAKRSAKKFGGISSDYLPIHNFMDSSKAHVSDNRHRAILHTGFGIFLTESMFGEDITELLKLAKRFDWSDEELQEIKKWKQKSNQQGTSITNSNDRQVQVRDIAEQHVLEDFNGRIPSMGDFLTEMNHKPWMDGLNITKNQIKILD